jgi:hypothetical protein
MVPPPNLPHQQRERMKTCPQCNTGYPDSHTTCPTHGVPLNEIRDLKPGMVIHQSYRIVRKLGQGKMGLEPFRRLLNDKRFAHAAFIAETPVEEPGDEERNVKVLLSLVK